MGRKIRLTESEFHTLIRRIIKETQEEMNTNMSGEMEENIFGDMGRGFKRFTKGYGDEAEKADAEREFLDQLQNYEDEMADEGFENTYYRTQERWEDAKQKLIDRATENDFLGELEVDELFRETRIKYNAGASSLTHLKRGLTGGAGSALRGGHTFGGGRGGTTMGGRE